MKAISLFSGVGGLDAGFEQAGVEVTWAIEVNWRACLSYERHMGLRPACMPIQRVERFPDAELVVACNPCQGYSIIGNRDEHDPRNLLYEEVARCLTQVAPKYFVLENVPGLVKLYDGRAFKRVCQAMGTAGPGYVLSHDILDAKDYGVAQDRRRVFIVGVRRDLGASFDFDMVGKTHGPGTGRNFCVLRDVLRGLPRVRRSHYYHLEDDWPFFYMSRNRRRTWHQRSYTIMANWRHVPLHPRCPPLRNMSLNEWKFTADESRYRRLSYIECARVQGFSQKMIRALEGWPLEEQYRFVGNAVPPPMAKALARAFVQFDEQLSARRAYALAYAR